jgi:hypothetical protein
LPKEKLEELSTERLKKRKKLVVITLTIVTSAVVLSAASLVYLIITGDLDNITFLIPGMICLFFIPLNYVGLKKISAELNKRNQT